MNRRDTIRTLMAASAGLIALPSWAQAWSAETLASHPSSFSMADQEILSAVADTIIPQGNDIGALSVGVDKFLQKLFDQCYEKDIQDNIKKQLAVLDASAGKSFARAFAECDHANRQELLLKFANSEDKAEHDFFELVRSETIRGFSTSKEVMVNYHNYKVAPGHYEGCVDIKT